MRFSKQVDVIVNTTSENLMLSNGEISKAISQAAGSQMQDEIQSQKKKIQVTTEDILATKGYKLKSKQVYHTVCAPHGHDSYKKVSLCYYDYFVMPYFTMHNVFCVIWVLHAMSKTEIFLKTQTYISY